jgi:hypothetical protein
MCVRVDELVGRWRREHFEARNMRMDVEKGVIPALRTESSHRTLVGRVNWMYSSCDEPHGCSEGYSSCSKFND